MRTTLYLSLIIIVSAFSKCGTSAHSDTDSGKSKVITEGKPELEFNSYEHDFGKVVEGQKVSYTFTFENKGKSDLIISSAKTSCGCTIPKYDTQPIPPGKNGNLEVVFNTSGFDGMQTKTITVSSNASKPVVLLKITAIVVNAIN